MLLAQLLLDLSMLAGVIGLGCIILGVLAKHNIEKDARRTFRQMGYALTTASLMALVAVGCFN